MLFTVELKWIDRCFRLQKNGSWRECARDMNLQDSDFACSTPSEVTEHSDTQGMAEINGIEYIIDPDQIEPFSEERYLCHSSSVFRRDYPEMPTVDQLKSAIASGDDSVSNCLILTVDGRFELRQDSTSNQCVNDPSIVVRHETFIFGNGYVGPEAPADESFIRDTFVSSLEHWKNHLKCHLTQEYSDVPASETLDDLQKELEELRENWLPDY